MIVAWINLQELSIVNKYMIIELISILFVCQYLTTLIPCYYSTRLTESCICFSCMLCGAESCPLTVCKANQSSGTAKTIYLPEQRDCCLTVTDIETSVWQTGPVVSMSQPAKRESGETHGIKVESNKPPTHRYRYHFTVSLPRSNQNLLTAP